MKCYIVMKSRKNEECILEEFINDALEQLEAKI